MTQTVPVADEAKLKGSWGPVIPMPNVAIHTHVLPNGKVLFWGRRDTTTLTLNEHSCTPIIWDPGTNEFTQTPQPEMLDGTSVNLFCSGHTFLPDGRLLVIGGHWLDSQGVNQASLYDFETNTWKAVEQMNHGRWYPTAITLPDGSVLALSGSFVDTDGKTIINNDEPQIWNQGPWDARAHFPAKEAVLQLYPRLHVAPDGRVFMSGPLAQGYFFDTSNPPGNGAWTQGDARNNNLRDYAPAVAYDEGKVLFIGGGNDPATHQPTNACEIIDLATAAPKWQETGAMHFARRQHNATILPDGTVLVTGGTGGGGGPDGTGFNDLTPGQPAHTAELWDPATGQWTQLASEQFDRCYHSTTVLLPDATVLSAGGGEYFPVESTQKENDPKDSHRNGQVFSPPYLFRGPRPDITAAPGDVSYGQTFQIGTSHPDEIGRVTWIRLPSVTHSFDQNQRINFLEFVASTASLTVTAPNNANVCPPGHYMLFVLNKRNVPSIAKIIRIHVAVTQPPLPPTTGQLLSLSARSGGIMARNREIDLASKGTHAVVGLNSTCPYGISACWGGAYEGLQHLEGARWIRPIPNAADSTASVFLIDDRLPEVDKWPEQFARTANGSYLFRGVEVSIHGSVEEREGQLVLQETDLRPSVTLTPIQERDKIQWDHKSGQSQLLTNDERNAYQQLRQALNAIPGQALPVYVTGPLKKTDAGFVLSVREFRS